MQKKIQVFIDGLYGTTGLEIRNALASHPTVNILAIPEDRKKDPALRCEYAAAADAVILCLNDADAISAVKNYARFSHLKIIDASTAHRTNPDWAYGLAELTENSRQHIAQSRFISNPGCYPIGVCLILRPPAIGHLLNDHPFIVVTGISGYSGGGKSLIQTYEAFAANGQTAQQTFRTYSLASKHKHLAEMTHHSAYNGQIHFIPAVAATRRGMIIRVHLKKNKIAAANIVTCLKDAYAKSGFIRVHDLNSMEMLTDDFLSMNKNNAGNNVDIACFHNGEQVTIVARYDNLGKGASLNAIQNLNIAFGFEERTGITDNEYAGIVDGEVT